MHMKRGLLPSCATKSFYHLLHNGKTATKANILHIHHTAINFIFFQYTVLAALPAIGKFAITIFLNFLAIEGMGACFERAFVMGCICGERWLHYYHGKVIHVYHCIFSFFHFRIAQ